jgi:MerR family transcriptional regulator/heat shock protein HspR
MAPRFNEPLFVISVAARLVEMHPQTLRKYEREGLIAPSRTTGNLRLYSDRDIERLRQVKYLVEECGLNLAGVQLALEMTNSLHDLRDRLGRMAASIDRGDGKGAAAEFSSSFTGVDRALKLLGYEPLGEQS